jgi:hypothetical protein
MKYLLILTIFFFSIYTAAENYSLADAQRLDSFLKKIEKSQRKDLFLHKMTFTETQLNAYLNLIYTKQYAPEITEMKFSLKQNNSISGFMNVRLQGKQYEKVPSFLKKFAIDFDTVIEVENYRLRYAIKKLKINGTEFSPEILDEVFSAAQPGLKVKKSLFDWFDLMTGIKDIKIDHKIITVFY